MADYVRPMTHEELIKGSFVIYARNFVPLAAIVMIPTLFVLAIQFSLQAMDAARWHFVLSFGQHFIWPLVIAVFTVAVCDACLTDSVSLSRSIGRGLQSMTGKLIGTYMLMMILTIIGLLLMVIPGIFVIVFFILVMTTVVLERIAGVDALHRSRQLGQGYHLRNFCILALVIVPYMTVWGSISVAMLNMMGAFDPDVVGALAEPVYDLRWMAWNGALTTLSVLSSPPLGILYILLYFDMRARKEGYDRDALAADLAR